MDGFGEPDQPLLDGINTADVIRCLLAVAAMTQSIDGAEEGEGGGGRIATLLYDTAHSIQSTLIALDQLNTFLDRTRSFVEPKVSYAHQVWSNVTDAPRVAAEVTRQRIEAVKDVIRQIRKIDRQMTRKTAERVVRYAHGRAVGLRTHASDRVNSLVDSARIIAAAASETTPARLVHYARRHTQQAAATLIQRSRRVQADVVRRVRYASDVIHDQTLGRLIRSGPYQFTKGYTDAFWNDMRVVRQLHSSACDGSDSYSLAPLTHDASIAQRIRWRTRRLVYAVARFTGQGRKHMFQRSILHWPLDSLTLLFQLILLYLPERQTNYDEVRQSLQDCLRWFEHAGDNERSSVAIEGLPSLSIDGDDEPRSLDSSFIDEISAASGESATPLVGAMVGDTIGMNPHILVHTPIHFDSNPSSRVTTPHLSPAAASTTKRQHHKSASASAATTAPHASHATRSPSNANRDTLPLPSSRSPRSDSIIHHPPHHPRSGSLASHTSHTDSISSMDSIVGASHAHAIYTRALDLLAREGIDIRSIDMSSSSELDDDDDAEEDDDWDRYSLAAKEIRFHEPSNSSCKSSPPSSPPAITSPTHKYTTRQYTPRHTLQHQTHTPTSVTGSMATTFEAQLRLPSARNANKPAINADGDTIGASAGPAAGRVAIDVSSDLALNSSASSDTSSYDHHRDEPGLTLAATPTRRTPTQTNVYSPEGSPRVHDKRTDENTQPTNITPMRVPIRIHGDPDHRAYAPSLLAQLSTRLHRVCIDLYVDAPLACVSPIVTGVDGVGVTGRVSSTIAEEDEEEEGEPTDDDTHGDTNPQIQPIHMIMHDLGDIARPDRLIRLLQSIEFDPSSPSSSPVASSILLVLIRTQSSPLPSSCSVARATLAPYACRHGILDSLLKTRHIIVVDGESTVANSDDPSTDCHRRILQRPNKFDRIVDIIQDIANGTNVATPNRT